MLDFNLSEYDSFDIGRYDRTPVPLDEAIREAEAIRKADPDNVPKVTPADASYDSFYVETVDRETAEAETLARLTAHWLGMSARIRAIGG